MARKAISISDKDVFRELERISRELNRIARNRIVRKEYTNVSVCDYKSAERIVSLDNVCEFMNIYFRAKERCEKMKNILQKIRRNEISEVNLSKVLEEITNIYLVYEQEGYKLFVQVPGIKCLDEKGEAGCDFIVWYEDSSGRLKKPSHKDIIDLYLSIMNNLSRSGLDISCINDIIDKLVFVKLCPTQLLEQSKCVENISRIDHRLYLEMHKFINTLWWIVLQEEANYPPSRDRTGALMLWSMLNLANVLFKKRKLIARYRGFDNELSAISDTLGKMLMKLTRCKK